MYTDAQLQHNYSDACFIHIPNGTRKISIKPAQFCSYISYPRRPLNGSIYSLTELYKDCPETFCDSCGKFLKPKDLHNHAYRCLSCCNLSNNKHSGDISKKAHSRFQTYFDWMYYLSKHKKIFNEHNKKWYPVKIAMLTIKLPCTQLNHVWDKRPDWQKFVYDITTHKQSIAPNPLTKLQQSDLYIKHYMLNSFLTILRKKHNLNLYIWRAERQWDEVLHFHILHDRFIGYDAVNKIWNKILKDHGYIDQYKKNQEAYHSNGFRYRPEWDRNFDPETGKKIRKWSRSQQEKAYNKGISEDWQCPIGTSDIHALSNIKDTRAYMSSYISKKVDIAKKTKYYQKKYCEKYKVENCPRDITVQIETEIHERLKIEGNIWYISQSLSKLKSIIVNVDELIAQVIRNIQYKTPSKILHFDWCDIYKFDIYDIINKNFTPLIKPITTWTEDVLNKVYPVENSLFSTLGIPLSLNLNI